MSITAVTDETAFRRCARLFQELHRLIAAGQDDSDDAAGLRAMMDPLWKEMTEEERERIGGLSEDLYILAEGGAKQAAMSADEEARWSAEATNVLPGIFTGQRIDAALKFLRRPISSSRDRDVIPFLQARCWEKLGENELALLFMKEAARLNSHQAVCVLLILQRLGRNEEAAEWAERIIHDEESSGEELYQAAATLLQRSRQMNRPSRRPIFQRLVPILERALKVYFTTPRGQREVPDGDRYIITMLGFCHDQLGNAKITVQLYNDGLARYPGDATLLTVRGLALIDTDLTKALGDCKKAAQAGATSMWPYYFLAWAALGRGNYAETWRLCLAALQRSGGSDREVAQLHEWLAIALAESGQALDWVLENFKLAESRDPSNERIRHNRAVAEGRRAAPTSATRMEWMIDGRASSAEALEEAYDEGKPAPDLFVERADTSVAALLQHA